MRFRKEYAENDLPGAAVENEAGHFPRQRSDIEHLKLLSGWQHFGHLTSVSLSSCALPVSMATPTDSKLLKQTKFPPEFNQKVDVKKVNIEVMKK